MTASKQGGQYKRVISIFSFREYSSTSPCSSLSTTFLHQRYQTTTRTLGDKSTNSHQIERRTWRSSLYTSLLLLVLPPFGSSITSIELWACGLAKINWLSTSNTNANSVIGLHLDVLKATEKLTDKATDHRDLSDEQHFLNKLSFCSGYKLFHLFVRLSNLKVFSDKMKLEI